MVSAEARLEAGEEVGQALVGVVEPGAAQLQPKKTQGEWPAIASIASLLNYMFCRKHDSNVSRKVMLHAVKSVGHKDSIGCVRVSVKAAEDSQACVHCAGGTESTERKSLYLEGLQGVEPLELVVEEGRPREAVASEQGAGALPVAAAERAWVWRWGWVQGLPRHTVNLALQSRHIHG